MRKNNIVKDANIKELIEKPIEIKSLKEDKNTTDLYPNWFDKNNCKNILAIIDSNKLNLLILKTWLILKIIKLVKYLLKKV